MLKLIDAHTHIQVPRFNKDREEVIKRALDKNIWIVNVGDDKKTSIDAVELASKYSDGIYAAVGQHPSRKEIFDYEFYKKLAQKGKTVAVGECGLEYYERGGKIIDKAEKERQKELFLQHIKLANEVKKSLMVHCREAFPDLIEILNSQSSILNSIPGILHFFTGTVEDAKKLLDMGFCFTFGGLITFNRSFDEIIEYIPLDRIMVETDAPYVSPEPYRGKRNEPVYVIEVAKKLAEIKKVSFEEVCEKTTENVKKVFRI